VVAKFDKTPLHLVHYRDLCTARAPYVSTIVNKDLVVRGTVTEALPNTMFRVTYEKDGTREETIAYLGGRMKFNRIRVLVGDEVELLLDGYGGRSRITRRGK
jgi:translation initiation factor IF-1